MILPTNTNSSITPAFLDVKGVGAKDPFSHDPKSTTRTSHGNGLFNLFEAMYDYCLEKTVSTILQYHARMHDHQLEHTYSTVGTYAVLSLGFQVPHLTADHGTKYFVAGGFVRQVSRRHPNPHGWMDVHEAVTLEQILNSYGIRSDGPSTNIMFARLPNPNCRIINLQGTLAPRTLTDFGTIQGDDSPTWPPSEDECLVHWGNTARIIDPTLWNSDQDKGSASVRNFIKRVCESITHPTNDDDLLDYEFVRHTNNRLMQRLWEMDRCFWHGQCSIEQVREVMQSGIIEDIRRLDQEQGHVGTDGDISCDHEMISEH